MTTGKHLSIVNLAIRASKITITSQKCSSDLWTVPLSLVRESLEQPMDEIQKQSLAIRTAVDMLEDVLLDELTKVQKLLEQKDINAALAQINAMIQSIETGEE